MTSVYPARSSFVVWSLLACVAAAPVPATGAPAARAAAAVQETSAPPQDGYEPQVGQYGKDVIWVPTPQPLVDMMLEMADATGDDYLIDLGSGDGRWVITAAKGGLRAHGIEFNPDLVALSRRLAAEAGVAERATFAEADLFASDFSDATILSMFLLQSINLKLRPTVFAMRPGTRVLSNSFTMGEWAPDETRRLETDCVSFCTAHLWIVPAKVEGVWIMEGQRLALTQVFQQVAGTLGEAPLADGRLRGTAIAFRVGDRTYSGEIDGARMSGTVSGGGTWAATRTDAQTQPALRGVGTASPRAVP